ncbi:hypothetical protein SPB21_27660 [Leptothoe sp. ISB3NOV94-8A]
MKYKVTYKVRRAIVDPNTSRILRMEDLYSGSLDIEANSMSEAIVKAKGMYLGPDEFGITGVHSNEEPE